MLNFDIRRKYFSILTKKILDIYATITGIPPLSLPNSKGKNLKSYNISGNVDEEIIEYSDGTAIEGKPNLLRTLGRTEQAVSGNAQTKRILQGDKWAKLMANNNPSYPSNVVVGEGTVSFNALTTDYGVSFPVRLKPNHSYTVYANASVTNSTSKMIVRIAFYAADGTWVSQTAGNNLNSGMTLKSFTVPANAEMTSISFVKYGDESGIDTPTLTFSDIMLVEGVYTTSNAPAYTPYKQLLTDCNGVGDKTKNLFDEEDILMAISGATKANGYYVYDMRQARSAYNTGLPITGFKENTRYTVSIYGRVTDHRQIIQFAYTDGTTSYGNFLSLTDTLTTITSSANKTVDKIVISYGSVSGQSGDDFIAYIKYFQIEESPTATDYEPYGYKIPVLSSGKNLLNGTLNYNATGFNKASYLTAGTYTLSFDLSATSWRWTAVVYDGNQNRIPDALIPLTPAMYRPSGGAYWVQNVANSQNYITFTLYRDAYISWGFSGGDTSASTTVTNAQIEIGSERTEYEPYVAGTSNNIFINDSIYKIGENVDTVNYPQNKTVKSVGKYVFTGNETIELYDNSKGFRFAVSDMETGNCIDGYCNRFENFKNSADNDVPRVFFGYNNNYVYFRRFSDTATTAEAIKAILVNWYSSGKPLTIWYPLENETEETVTLPDIPTVQGNATIMIDTNVQPSEMSVEYAVEGV